MTDSSASSMVQGLTTTGDFPPRWPVASVLDAAPIVKTAGGRTGTFMSSNPLSPDRASRPCPPNLGKCYTVSQSPPRRSRNGMLRAGSPLMLS